jgi:hypothetical protein
VRPDRLAPDASVGPGESRAIDPGTRDVHPSAVAVGPDGKAVVGGFPSRDSAGHLCLFGTSGDPLRAVRLTAAGQVDSAYGNTAQPGLFQARVVAVRHRPGRRTL